MTVEPVAGVTPTRVRYTVLAWFCALSMITYIDRVCIKQVQDDMQRDLGLSSQQFAWAFSAFALAYALFEMPTGWLGDKLGTRKVLLRIVLCWLLFTSLTGLAIGLITLVIVRFLFGAGEAGAYPNIARGTRNWFPYSERGQAQGWVWTFGRWGGAIAPLLIIALTEPFNHEPLSHLGLPGWRCAFIILGVLGLIWVWGFAVYFKDRPSDHPSVNQAELTHIEQGLGSADKPAPLHWKTMLTSRTLWILSLMYFCSNCGWSIFITYDTKFLKNNLGLEGWTLHFASGVPLLLGGIGCVLGGLLTDRQVRSWGPRWGRTAQGVIAYSLGTVGFLAAIYFTLGDSQPLLAFTCLCLASFVKDFGMGASWATTIDIGHRYSGTVAGFMNMIGNLGTVVSPPIVAFIASRFPLPDGRDNIAPALFYYAGMFGIAAVCWLFINPRRVIVYSPQDQERLRAQGVIH